MSKGGRKQKASFSGSKVSDTELLDLSREAVLRVAKALHPILSLMPDQLGRLYLMTLVVRDINIAFRALAVAEIGEERAHNLVMDMAAAVCSVDVATLEAEARRMGGVRGVPPVGGPR